MHCCILQKLGAACTQVRRLWIWIGLWMGNFISTASRSFSLSFGVTPFTQRHEIVSQNVRDSRLSCAETPKSLFHLVLDLGMAPGRDTRTDRQTDRITVANRRYSYLSRAKMTLLNWPTPKTMPQKQPGSGSNDWLLRYGHLKFFQERRSVGRRVGRHYYTDVI